jgi:two-component system, cell cycle sensor histidine kinase and response regulator CckA
VVGQGEKLTLGERIASALGALFVDTAIPIFVMRPDDGSLVAANGAAVARYGYALHELVTMHIGDIVHEGDAGLSLDLRRAAEGPHTTLARRRHRRKDGSLLWAIPNAGPVVVDGVRYIVSAITDVTALVDAEQRAEAVWHAASELLTDGIALLDRDLRIVRTNRNETTELAIGTAVVGKRCSEVFAICAGQEPCPHRVALVEGLHLVRELQDGERPFRHEIIPATPNDADIAVIHVAHDLSDERAMRTRLLTADRLATIGRLAAGVAHEINNPAAFVTVNLGVLRDRFLAGNAQRPEVLSMLDDSLNGMERIREIVRDLKGFARERSRDVVDLSQVALSAIRIAAHETRGRARVDRSLGEDVLARARGARLAQCVLNLLVNAAQAIPAGNPGDHRIEVRTYRNGVRVCLEVSDTGPGVPPALRRRIFEPFFTTREATGGTGLGLWLARGIIEEEDGSLEVGDAPSGGARFTIELPAYVADAPAGSVHADQAR